MKKTEFSKRILIFAGAVTILVTAFTMYMIWETKDLSPLMYLIPAVFTETASSTGFYYWKAKGENVLKIARNLKQEGLTDEDIQSVKGMIEE